MNNIGLVLGRKGILKGHKTLLSQKADLQTFHTLETRFRPGTLLDNMRGEHSGWVIEDETRSVLFAWVNLGEPFAPPFLILSPTICESGWFNIPFQVKRLRTMFVDANTVMYVPRWLDVKTRNPSYKDLHGWSRRLALKYSDNYTSE